MSLSPRLDLRATQNLVMTPQLQQAIRLLQMSNQELSDWVAQEAESNPLLELVEPDAEPAPADRVQETPAIPASPGAEDSLPSSAAPDEETTPHETRQDADAEDPWALDEGSLSEGYGLATRSGGDEDDEPLAFEGVAAGPSLREHILTQIHIDFTDPVERMIAAALVEFLDDAGYLPADLTLARAQLGASDDMFDRVIARLQTLDPPGIFARSLAECLALQLRERNRLDPAMQTLLANLDLVAKRDNAALMRRCGVDAADLADMLRELRALDPKPAATFAADVAAPIVPDLFLRRGADGGWRVDLNEATLPRALANARYYAEVQKIVQTKADRDYLGERWQQASWLARALDQRAQTILRVAAEIVRQQDAFFVHGVQRLKPLVLRDIAAATELHESTVSRVTQNKYIATPRGLFELKYFFTSAVGGIAGEGTVSATTVRERIRALIAAEAPGAILSDDRLAEILKAEGIEVARRTVAKYRESLRIPSSAQRRREKRV